MKKNFWAASAVALALFTTGALAQESTDGQQQPAAEAAAPQLPEALLNLVSDTRPAQDLSDQELAKRSRQAQRFLKSKGLPDDVRSQLQAMVDADGAELAARSQASQQAPAPAEQPAEQPAAQTEAAPQEQPAAQTEAAPQEQPAEQPAAEAPKAAEAPAALPEQVQAVLADGRAPAELSVEELKARQQTARKFSRDEKLPDDVRQKLAEISKQARQEIMSREAAAQQPAQQEQAPAAEAPAEQAPAEQAPAEQAQQPAPDATPPADQSAGSNEPATPPAEQPAAGAAGEQPAAPVADKAQVQQLDGNQGDPELEAKAKLLLDDGTAADQLDDEKLRQRLEDMRGVMESNKLSRDTERALRKKLRADRQVLRERLAKVKAEEEAKAAAEAAAKAAEQGKTDSAEAGVDKKPGAPVITDETPRRKVLLDRRPSDELDDNELRIRIRIYRDFEQDPSYQDFDEEQRGYWRDTVRRDRERLRYRMEEERNIRRVRLDDETDYEGIDINDENYGSYDDYGDDVFAAEVDDSEIEKVLVAPPRKKVRRVASVQDIEDNPDVRNSLRRIEIDTIHFGFNESFVREEEIDSLDGIAQVIEKVLRKYPREVFLIEGHTDAVGSDAYNNKLSKARAEAVKKALSSFYLIPSRNLETAGLGERYLKIPTADAEAENRRVSISRATSVLGEAADQ